MPCVIFLLSAFLHSSYFMFSFAELAGHQVVTGSEHICLPAVHVFTPDPSQVTVWVTPPFTLPPPTPLPKMFPSYR